jgi:hypothetical protein
VIFSDTLTFTRYAAETRGADGRATSGASSTFTAACSVQRPKPHTLRKLQEGGHTDDAWYVDTVTPVRTRNESTGTPPDVVTIDGQPYEVFEVAHVRGVIVHYETLVLRKFQGIA